MKWRSKSVIGSDDLSLGRSNINILLQLALVGVLLPAIVLGTRHGYAASTTDTDIRGVWRPATATDCSDAQLFIEDAQISIATKAIARVPIDFDIVIFNPPHA